MSVKAYIAGSGFLLMLVCCYGDTDTTNTPQDQSMDDRVVEQTPVGSAIEGSRPVIQDKEKDMALVAEETAAHKEQSVAAKKERDRDLARMREEQHKAEATKDRSL